MKNLKQFKRKFLFVVLLVSNLTLEAQTNKVNEGNVNNLPVREHTITLREATVNKAGIDVMGMTVNGTIPGPTL